jgi:hypothetical protein
MMISMPSSRDDFPEATKRALAARVNYRCSRPDCRAQTSGPQVEAGKTLNVGVAAHITGAAPGGPRYDTALASRARADIANGVWLCQTCAKLIDSDPARFTAAVLWEWKSKAEQQALDLIGKTAFPHGATPPITDKWVNMSYPEKAGIVQALKAQGYQLRWTTANEEAEKIDLQGWEPVLVDQADGSKARLKIRDHPFVGGYVILLRKRTS